MFFTHNLISRTTSKFFTWIILVTICQQNDSASFTSNCFASDEDVTLSISCTNLFNLFKIMLVKVALFLAKAIVSPHWRDDQVPRQLSQQNGFIHMCNYFNRRKKKGSWGTGDWCRCTMNRWNWWTNTTTGGIFSNSCRSGKSIPTARAQQKRKWHDKTW